MHPDSTLPAGHTHPHDLGRHTRYEGRYGTDRAKKESKTDSYFTARLQFTYSNLNRDNTLQALPIHT